MVTGGLTFVDDVEYYRIDGVEDMEPFLMTVVSDSDLWMFVSSSGALTAGRVDADHALFPYETDDRIHRLAGLSGPVTVIARTIDDRRELWRPFARERTAGCTRALAKSVLGDRLVFEERHPTWGLVVTATWAASDAHGWVRTVELRHVDDGSNDGGERADIEIEVLDGLLDVMPAGVDAHTEQIRSNLVDAYKRSEAGPWGRLAVYSLESLITDRAEPAESLAATVVWSAGFEGARIDLDSRAVAAVVAGQAPPRASLVTGRPGAYLLHGAVTVTAAGAARWMFVADTGLGHADVAATVGVAAAPDAADAVRAGIDAGSSRLRTLLAGADAFQATADPLADAHHLSNVLFNSIRGGVFPNGHTVSTADFTAFVELRNRDVLQRRHDWLQSLGDTIDVAELRGAALASGDVDLVRLVLEYLPLTFSRRHGDPSRPWNRFSIDVRDDDGGQLLSYEGNWRDIFQNWEALLVSFPAYYVHVIAKFVDASTIEGYNPYRISRDGIDWEVPNPDDPWSHIGYWGDHQIVYLLRLLEAWQQHEPDALGEWLLRPVFAYADVPYTLADHDEMVRDPQDTISYDDERAAAIAAREADLGSEGRLFVDDDGDIVRVALLEKLLVPALGKLTNFVADGGIWLNTQRPEWNDANNALAGPGLSMVTLCHLHRYLAFVDELLDGVGADTVPVSASVATWMHDLLDVFDADPATGEPVDDRDRRRMLDALGRAGTAHRHRVRNGGATAPVDVAVADIGRLCESAGEHLRRTLRSARRPDGLYHSYNRVSFPTDDAAGVDHLGPMLEGQVAVLSSGTLDAPAALDVIDALFDSELHRPDQDTFLLYPATRLVPFLDRNIVPAEAESHLAQLHDAAADLLDGPLARILQRDPDGRLRFRPGIANAAALAERLDRAGVPAALHRAVQDVYEQVVDHRSFTGRSGSMYGYEGLGSVYWHMVAKLLLAVQEVYWAAVDHAEPDDVVHRLGAAYRRVRAGLGMHKDPVNFGAIPTDCYSHTPAHAGAQQPGMTGQVKEEVLTRFGELGLRVVDGCVALAPGLIAPDEVLPGGPDAAREPARFSRCATPMTLSRGGTDAVVVIGRDGARVEHAGLRIDADDSRALFARTGAIAAVEWVVGDATAATWASGATDRA